MFRRKKTKSFKNFKIDPFNNIFFNASKTTSLRSTKDLKYELYEKVRKNQDFYSEIAKYNVSILLDAVSSDFNRNDILDFSSKNKRDVFIRKKRKSGYGLSLIEKQKAKLLFPKFDEKIIKEIFEAGKNRLAYSNSSPICILDFIGSRYNHKYIPKYYVDGYEAQPFQPIIKGQFLSFLNPSSTSYSEGGSKFPILNYVKNEHKNFYNHKNERIFSPIPQSFLIDHRINKAMVIFYHEHNNIINFNMIISHYYDRRD